MSASSMRGQLGVKSSPLAPTSAKLTTQMLVISHMENHYKKINKAKPAIDNRPPKSMMSSQKMRDRRSRKQIERHGSRPSSRLTYRANSADHLDEDIFDENQWDEPEDDEERQVRDIMRTTLRGPLKAQHDIINIKTAAAADSSDLKDECSALGMTMTRPQSAALQRVVQRNAAFGRTRPVSARSTTSLASNLSQMSRSTNPAKVTYDGDVLNKHANSFTEPTKPFTPRTLKSNRQSSLKNYKYYTAPPPKKSQPMRTQTPDTEVEEKVSPPIKPRARSTQVMKDLDTTQTLTETMLMDMSLQSHDHRQGHGESGVPRLDISLDKDHLNWVKDQAARVQQSDDVVVA